MIFDQFTTSFVNSIDYLSSSAHMDTYWACLDRFRYRDFEGIGISLSVYFNEVHELETEMLGQDIPQAVVRNENKFILL